MRLRVVVADDEAPVRADLVRMLQALDVLVVGEASDGQEALALTLRERPDLLFLDIQMPLLDGLSLAARDGLPPIVFVTAHPEHAHHAFDLDACDYVVKPITKERISMALLRAGRRVELETPTAGNARLRVTEGRTTRFIDARRIEAFWATDKYIAFRDGDEEHLLRASMNELEAQLGEHGFLRVHRAHLVRVSSIESMTDGAEGLVLTLTSGARVPVSRRARAAVLSAFE
jgi:DNA-binding LytR/AlgR family response regulator